MPPIEATKKSRPTRPIETVPSPAATAVRRATSAVASLNSDSPSRIVTIRRGSPIRRPIAVAATASGGATTAPIAREAHQSRPGSKACTSTPTPSVVNTTSPTLSRRIARRWALKSTSEVWIAAAYSRGGRSPSRTTSALRWTVGTPGTYDPTTPRTISPSGAGKPRRSAIAVPASTETASATSRKAISTRTISPRADAARWSCSFRDPPHRVAPPELVVAEPGQGEDHDRAPVRREGDDVGDHPAVGEHRGLLADRVDEGVVEPALVADLADVSEVARALDAEAAAHRGQRLVVLHAPVVVAGGHRGVPHPHLPDQSTEDRPDRLGLVRVVLDRHGSVELGVGEVARDADQLAGQPDVVLDHLLQQVGPAGDVARREPDAARRHEVDGVRLADLDVARLLAPLARGFVVRLGERARERLVRGVAGLDRDVEQRRPGGDHPVRRALEQDAPAQRLRGLATDRLDHPVEVEAREVVARRPVVAGAVVVVEGLGEPVDEVGEGVGCDAHDLMVPRPRRPCLDHGCSQVGGEGADPLVEVAPVVTAYDGLDDLDPAVRAGQRLLELGNAVHLEVRRARGGTQAAEVGAVRGAEEAFVAVGVLLRPLLEGREDRATVVVGHHDRQVGAGLVGAEDEAVAVVQEGHVADQGEAAVGYAAERSTDGGRDHAVDAGQAAVGDHLAARADLVARDHQIEVAD